MDVKTLHVRLEGSSSFEGLIASLADEGLFAVFRDSRTQIEEQLRSLGLAAPAEALGPRDVEVLTTPERNGTVLLRLDRGRFPVLSASGRELDVLLMSEDHCENLQGRVEAALGTKLVPHSWTEARAVEERQARLGDLSPNGKMLANPDLRAAARALYDDELRGNIAAIIAAFQSVPAPERQLEQLDPFKNDNARLKRLLESEAMSPRFAIRCAGCAVMQLAFADRDRAESAVQDSGGKCLRCSRGQLRILETFGVAEQFASTLQQGVWLESLVSDTLAARTELVWTGQMVESNEVDVLAIFADKTLLAECKDTAFGQTDLYVTAAKAEQVKADLVIVVSTRDVHPNVLADIERIGKAREFRVVSEASAHTIQTRLGAMADELSQQRLTSWLGGAASQFEYYYDLSTSPARP